MVNDTNSAPNRFRQVAPPKRQRPILFSLERIYGEKESCELIYQQHRAVFDAVMKRDPEAAREAARLHLSYVVTSVAQYEAQPKRKLVRKTARPSLRGKP